MESTEIAVIGAGFAGLMAARTLRLQGRRAVVLEARDRVGGRAYSVPDVHGAFVDLGGQWLGPTQHEALALVKELQLPTFPTWTRGDNLLMLGGKARRYRGTIPRVGLLDLLSVGLGQFRLDHLARKVPLASPWKAPEAAAWDATSLGAFLEQKVGSRVARKLLQIGLEAIFAAPLHEISLLYALFYIHSGKDLDMLFGVEGGAQATRIDGGMQTVATALARGLEVRLSTPVSRLVQDATGVTVEHAGGALRAQRVIVAVPPRLVDQLSFEPPLPPARARLMRDMPMGSVIKCTAIYERPFWREQGLSGAAVTDRPPLHVIYDNSPPDARRGVLMGFAEADNARALAPLPEAERRHVAVESFAAVFGEQARQPLGYTDHVWQNDPWSGGCYGAYMPVGLLTSCGEAMRPPHERVHWAGTETAEVWSGYIDGALRSGKRAAAEVQQALGATAVTG